MSVESFKRVMKESEKMGEAYTNILTGEITETNELTGRIGFQYAAGEGYFEVSRVEVEMSYTEELILRWTIRLPVEPGALPGIMPLLTTLGVTDAQVLNLAPDERMEVSLSARPDVRERLSPELVKLDKLSAMFQAGGNALLNLDDYEDGAFQILSTSEEEATTV